MSLALKNSLHTTALKKMKDLCDMFEPNYLIKDPTCFKTSNYSCIDNFYNNKKTMFFN